MSWINYDELPDARGDEELEYWLDKLIVPFFTGSRVIHIRSTEEDRIRGICKSLPRLNNQIRQLHVHSYSGTTSESFPTEEEIEFEKLTTTSSPNSGDQSEHYRILDSFIKMKEGGILLFVDSDRVLERDFRFIRLLKVFSMGLDDGDKFSERPAKIVIIHSVEQETPPSLARDIPFIDLPLPKDSTLEKCIESACQNPIVNIKMPEDKELILEWCRALRGLTSSEALNAVVQSLVMHGNQFSEEALEYLRSCKRDFIEQTGIMEFSEPTLKFSDVGGLDNLTSDLLKRRTEFENSAKGAGIHTPKGCLLAGLPGTGKSRIAKAVAGEWKLPMLEFSMANVLGSYVGSSEKNMRAVLTVAESLAPCVLFVDEIDKALSGLGSSGGDSGVTRRVIGSFLTWLNDREAEVYVIATANDLSEITVAMPEMLRKGRWDDIWWVDLPGEETRAEIIKIHLDAIPKERISDELSSNISSLAKLNQGCSGAELASAINEANRRAFHDKAERQITYEDLKLEIENIHPLASGVTWLEAQRQWMKENAKMAGSEGAPKVSKRSTIFLEGENKTGFTKDTEE